MTEILMPRLSDTMEEGVVSAWQKKPGDPIAVGDVIVDIETDKAVMEYEAYEAGVLQEILVPEGETAAIGAPIAVIAPTGSTPTPTTKPAETEKPTEAEKPPAPAPTPRPNGSRPPSSPLARRLARDHGLDLSTLNGSGPGGRIVRADIEAAIRATGPAPAAPPQTPPAQAQTPPAQTPPDDETELVPLTRFRKVAAKRLTESKRTAPHFYLSRDVDAEPLLAFRATLNQALDPAKISVNDLIVKACATALREHPEINVSFTEENLLIHRRVNVGVAVAVDGGLLVPVIRDADRKGVSQIGAETRELAAKARDGKLGAQEMSGGTFSVSNLGMFGVGSFSAVINPPESAILAVGAVRDEPVVRDGAVVPGKRLSITASFDHRAIDGAVGAKFLARLAELLQNPLLIVA
ncbi:dihydrolipoamide acetyltransferase family protein [Spirillospora sp. CA-294931]|uniref:dihydrolipoamide acetyltransferase family protein n=1 Tax=Spirillospora sp. CA-294931 TaxID=3240042 RepID=UPI003D9380D6